MTHVVVVNNPFRKREETINDDDKRKKICQNERERMDSYYLRKTRIYNGTQSLNF